MGSYISSNANRFYVGLEPAYGQAAAVGATNRFPAVRLRAHQNLQAGRRFDKTGTRTFLGNAASSRRLTAFEVRTYLTSWTGNAAPAYGALFQAALGAPPALSRDLAVSAMQGTLQLQTTFAHGLSFGSAVSYAGQIRFVTEVLDNVTVGINAPFESMPTAGSILASTVTYSVATALPSVTLFDYWDPITAVSRAVTGAGVDMLTLSVNGDFHEFTFSGPAGDLLDSTSFLPGTAGLFSFPEEPAAAAFEYSIVPGHLGEAWLGGPASQFFTMLGASVQVRNHLETRNEEFGSSYPRALSPGRREVTSTFSLLAQDDAQTNALYAAAKLRTALSVMLQLGQQQGRLMSVFLPQIMLEIPEFDDSEPRLKWNFQNNLAQGVSNDEIFIAFA